MPFAKTYKTLYERLVANTRLENEDDPSSCWIWTGSTSGTSDYPRVALRIPGRAQPLNRAAHRVMLEEFHRIEFPHDDAGHKCCNPRCINPLHLEVEAPALNHSVKRRFAYHSVCGDDRCIPILFPRWDHPDFDPELSCGELVSPGEPCPF